MSVEEIKSPLPPRRVEIPTEEVEAAKTDGGQVTEEKVAVVLKNEKKFNFSGLVPFILIGLVVLAIVVVVFRLVIPSMKPGGTNEITLNYWGLWEDESIVAGVIADFEAKNPGIKVNYRRNQRNDYRTRLIGRLAKEGTGEEVPDIFRIHNTWINNFLPELADVPGDTVERLKMQSDFFEIYKRDLVRQGKYKAIPLMYDSLGLFYNRDLLVAAQADLPKSWWDLKTTAGKITVKDESGQIRIGGAGLGLVDNVDHWSDVVGLMMAQNGLDPLKTDETNNKKLADVLSFYTLFRTQDKVWDENLPSTTEMFAQGKLGFYFGPSWRIFNLEEMNKGLNFEVTTVPQLPTLDSGPLDQPSNQAGLTNIHWATYWVEGVGKGSKHQKEAFKFLEYLASVEGLEKLHLAASQVRSFGEIYPRKSMVPKVVENKRIKPFVMTADNAVSWYLASRTFDAGINDEMSKYFGDAINSMVFQNVESKEAVTKLRDGINQLISKYQIGAK